MSKANVAAMSAQVSTDQEKNAELTSSVQPTLENKIADHEKINLITCSNKAFINAYERFIAEGNFIDFTQAFKQGLKETGYKNTLKFRVKNATAYLLDIGVLAIEPDINLTAHSAPDDSAGIATQQINVKPTTKAALNSSTEPNTPKSIVISSGIHGNETAPIEIVQQIVSNIVTKKIQAKQRCLFIIGNPVAMTIAKRFHTENLNRLFNGKHKAITSCFEKHRAEKLESYVTAFFQNNMAENNILAENDGEHSHNIQSTNYHYDLHTAIRGSTYEKFAIYPYNKNQNWNKEQLSFMASCGVNTILFGHAPSGTFSYYSSANFSAHAFTIELGKVKAFGENCMADFIEISTQLTALICGEPVAIKIFNNADFHLFKVLGEITKKSEEFTLCIDDNADNFTDYPVGSVLAKEIKQEYKTQQEGESIVFPNANVGLNQRAALIVIPTTLT